MLGAHTGTSDAEPEQLLQGRLSLSVFWAAETPYSSATDRDFRNGEARVLLNIPKQGLSRQDDSLRMCLRRLTAPRVLLFQDVEFRVSLQH